MYGREGNAGSNQGTAKETTVKKIRVTITMASAVATIIGIILFKVRQMPEKKETQQIKKAKNTEKGKDPTQSQ